MSFQFVQNIFSSKLYGIKCPTCQGTINGQTVSEHEKTDCKQFKQKQNQCIQNLFRSVMEMPPNPRSCKFGKFEDIVKRIEQEKEEKNKKEVQRKMISLGLSQFDTIPQKCPICQEDLAENDIQSMCMNGHFLHEKCIFDYVKAKNESKNEIKCPICREECTFRCDRILCRYNYKCSLRKRHL